jgi:hypothetical protein
MSWKKRTITDCLGNHVGSRVTYDNGRVVEYRTATDWLGNKIGTDARVIRDGSKCCFKCGREVDPDSDGFYTCCGRRFR